MFDANNPQTKRFIDAYKKEFKREPFSLPAYGYNAMYFVKDVLTRAGSTDKEKIRQALADTKDFPSYIGAKGATISFANGSRAGFPAKGAVIRVIEKNQHGKVVQAGF